MSRAANTFSHRQKIAARHKALAKGLYLASGALLVFATTNLIAQPAFAYVDPGSGLLLLQVIGSTFVGVVFLIRKRIGQAFGLLTKRKKVE